MKFSVSLMSFIITSALALSMKRQNDVPGCVDGNQGETSGGPYEGGTECEDDCYMTEQSGDRVGQICKGYCIGTPLVTGTVVYNCYGSE